ncbi:K02A2.6-like [Cordylochernes scorpioides]|uniref:RNA-directed DNA polymerase n=1 Tax=Cordylochernes scorpioides TaxID=51811 RepID=A0ABY6LSK5_9ARAC|nr:K02A2.6-like [Cordylochernes scorpioides]
MSGFSSEPRTHHIEHCRTDIYTDPAVVIKAMIIMARILKRLAAPVWRREPAETGSRQFVLVSAGGGGLTPRLARRDREEPKLLSNLNAKEQEYQITALIYLMGERAEEIHSAFNLSEDDAKNLDKVIEAFDNHFIGKRNVVYERALFGLRSQRPEETIEEFVTVLHRISEHCEYANLREELIRDRIVLGVKDRKLSEKLMLNENLTLAKAVDIARQWEAVMREQQDLNPSTSQVDTTRKVAKQKPKASGHGKDNGRSTSRQTDSAKETDEGKKFPTCFNCGTTKHHYRYRDKCPAKDKVCGKCGKKGHYTNLCRRKNNEVNAISSEETPAREKVSYVYAVREPTLGSRKSRWKSTVRVNGTAIHFKLDPGSDVTLIPFSLYKRYFSNVQLTPTDGQLMAAANQRLENAGTFVAKLRANTREMKETVYVVHHLEQPLLGVGACEDLQLVKRIDLVINGTTDVNPEREFPKLFEGLGLLEQPYHIKLKEGAKPFSIPEVIEPVDEPTEWCARIVLAGKPNGKIRICVDLSRLNLSVERELHPLPVLEHELAQLNWAKIFSRLDANSGFWQIKLSEESQTLTTFITPFGRYKFKRLPFGISSAPEHFQKRMSAILRGVNGVICHMDDILIFAKRKEEHDETLREVLRRLKNSGITLNKEKCQFGVSNVIFLGHYIDEHGIKANEKKVKAIAEMKPPTDVHGVQRFMGMFHLGLTTEKSFEKVKDVLASDRVLASFDISKKTMVSADASSYGLGAVLKQEHDANEWRPVAFASWTLTKTEQGYAQIEKEALAITWACERFKDFVVGKTFLIETDHKPLVPIFTTKDLNDLTPRLQWYRMRMLQFSFLIFHTPGKDLITADALSRQPLPGHLPEDEELQEEVEHFVRSIVLHQSTTDDRLAKIALNQKLEPTLQNVAFYSKTGWPAKCQLSPLERSFYDVRDEIGEENGLLMRGLRVIIPSTMRKDVLNRIHAGHQGIKKCRARAKDHVWWPGIGQEIQDMVKTCEKCIENQPLKHETLIPNDFPERPWQKIGMDLFHYEGSEYLVVVDYFSRFIEVVRLTKLSSEAVVDHCKAIFARHGIPELCLVHSATLDVFFRCRVDKAPAREIEYLGHLIKEDGIRPLDHKVQALQKAKSPTNISELRSFLGLVNYYGKFIPNLPDLLRPLHELLHKKNCWSWTKECEEAIEKCKSSITSERVLVPYDTTLPLFLATDASQIGIGAVLSHVIGGQERPIMFASRTLSGAERNYYQIEREALAIIYGVTKFHHNGLAERAVKMIKMALDKNKRKPGDTIQDTLSKILLAYRSTPHETAKKAPSELFIERSLRTRLSIIHPNLKSRVKEQQARQMKYDHGFQQDEFGIDDMVWCRNFRGGDRWIPGRIVWRNGSRVYTVLIHGQVKSYHKDQIRKRWENGGDEDRQYGRQREETDIIVPEADMPNRGRSESPPIETARQQRDSGLVDQNDGGISGESSRSPDPETSNEGPIPRRNPPRNRRPPSRYI